MDHDSLFCNEEFLASPTPSSEDGAHGQVFDLEAALELQCSNLEAATTLTNFPARDDAALRTLVEREASQVPQLEYAEALQATDEVAAARSSAVNWMLSVRKLHGFNPLTGALAVSYLDRYLSKQPPKPFKAWIIQLLSVACVSLAAKMEEIMVPCLADVQAAGTQYVFEAKTIQRMELVVLKALGWRMSGVTPFEYVDDLLYRLVDLARHTRASILARATELILGSLPETGFLFYRPSVVALAAISCALEETVPLKAETYRRTLLSALPMQETTLDSCYKLLEELVVDPVNPASLLSQIFGNPKSPPSPLTVIEMSRAVDTETLKSVDWLSIRERSSSNAASDKKRKLDDMINWVSSKRPTATSKVDSASLEVI